MTKRLLPYSLLTAVLFLFSTAWAGEDRFSLPDIIRENKLAQVASERKIEQSDVVLSMLMRMAEEAERKGEIPAAIAHAEKAVQFSPESPLPHFFLSHIHPIDGQTNFLRVVGEYTTALRLSLGQFWIFSSAIGMIGLFGFMAFLLSLLTFLVYSVVFYGPQWVHYVEERFSGRVYKSTTRLIMAFVLLALFFIFPRLWFLLIAPFLFWFFYNQQERGVAIAFGVGLIVFSLVLQPLLVLLTAKQSYLFDQMVKNQQHEFLWSEPSFSPSESDWKASFMKAAYYAQEKDLARAEALYQNALSKKPDSVLILNNLGNVSFYQDQLKDAMGYYEKATAIRPDYLPAHYNISQVYNEMLVFEKGTEKYAATKKIDQDGAEYYAQQAARYPNHPVVEGRFTRGDVWNALLTAGMDQTENLRALWRIWSGGFSPILVFVLSLFVGGGLLGLCRYLSKHIAGDFCSTCFKPICQNCEQTFSNRKICQECGSDLKATVARKVDTVQKKGYPFFMIPGGGQLVHQKPVLALFLLVPFYFLVTAMVMGRDFLTSAHGHLSVGQSAFFSLAILFLYGVSTLDLFFRMRR